MFRRAGAPAEVSRDAASLCLDGGISQIIRVAEGFHEKKVAEIADEIVFELINYRSGTLRRSLADRGR